MPQSRLQIATAIIKLLPETHSLGGVEYGDARICVVSRSGCWYLSQMEATALLRFLVLGMAAPELDDLLQLLGQTHRRLNYQRANL